VAKFEEHGRKFPGADIYVRPVRVYPEGKLAAHVLGYVGRADFSLDSDKAPDYYLPEMKGRKGLELQYNELLAGLPGAELIRVDASGFRRSVLEQKSKYPYPGEDVYTTLDARVQKLAEEIIAGRKGAAVVLDPRNGDVIAMASSPAFDPGVFSPAISEKDWQRFRGDEARPLLNRAVSGAYPPGSTFKPVVALTALENSDISANRTFNCPGYFELGGTPFRCWRRSGHGPLAMRKAIEQSCNVYFYQIGVKVGHRSIVHMARSLGFGAETGVELDYEVPGLVPDNAWKRRVYEDSWRPGDTCNISIGQGALLVTPLQMAVYTAALANGGKVYRPRLVREGGGRGDLENVMSWSDASLRVVRGGMHDVVNAGSGTGKRARIEAAEVAGKTGTAQYGPAGENKKHTWMIAFAPFDSPRYAAALIIEDGVSGGTTAAPRMGRLMKGIFELEAGGEPAGRLTWRDS
jgi:penicillin-binding protein 2